MLSDEEIGEALAAESDPEKLCLKLVEEANDRGGVDNITVVAVRIPDGASAPVASSSSSG